MFIMTTLPHALGTVALTLAAAVGACAQAADPNGVTTTRVVRCGEASADAVALLDQLEARGRAINAYEARVVYNREQGLLADTQTRLGGVIYQAADPNADRPARFAIRFQTLLVDGALRERPRAYVFDGTWLAEIHADAKQFIRRQITAPGKRYEPWKIGEGPFPLPLGQKRREVLELYHAKLIPPTDDDANGTRHLQLEPRHPERATNDLTRIDLWYDQASLLPVKIVTQDDAQNTTTVRLTDAKVNELSDKQLDGAFDTTPPSAPGWQIEVVPHGDGERGDGPGSSR